MKVSKTKIKNIFLGICLILLFLIPWNRDYFLSKISAYDVQTVFDEEVVWTIQDSPKIIEDEDFYFNKGLKIEEGVKVFFRGDSSLIIKDKFEVLGGVESDKEVVFQALDNSSDHFSVIVDEAEVVIIGNAIFQNGGQNQCRAFHEDNLFKTAIAYYIGSCLTDAALNIKNSQNINIFNSTFKNNYKAINIIDSENVYLEGNYFLHNEKMAIYSETEISIIANYNCWMRPSGPEYEGNPKGKGEKIIGNFKIDHPMQCGSDFKPIILVPGIGGGWNWSEMFAEVGLFDDWDFSPGVHFYDAWEESLKDLGYIKNRDYFIVYYDWRNDNKENLEKYLLPKLEKIKKISYDEKFDVIAHSMGGFITIDYLTGDDYQSDIDKVVLQGTPLMGASKVYPAWEGGLIPEGWETMKVYLSILFIGKPVNWELDNYDLIHKYVPSAKQLLPIYNYLEKDGELINFWEMEEKNDYLMGLIYQFFENKNGFDLENNLLMIQGTGHETSEKIRVEDYEGEDSDKLWKDGKIISEDFIDEGDGTVLNLNSGDIPSLEIITLEDTRHEELPAKAVAKTGEFLGVPFEDKNYSHKTIKERLMFLFACPIDVAVEDSEGNLISKDESQVEGAYYYSDGREDGYKIIEIQNPSGEYNLKIIGNGDGNYDALVYKTREGEESVSVEFSGEVSAGEEIEYNIISNSSDISVDKIVITIKESNAVEINSQDDEDKESDDEEEADDEDEDEDEESAKESVMGIALVNEEEDIFGNKMVKKEDAEVRLDENSNNSDKKKEVSPQVAGEKIDRSIKVRVAVLMTVIGISLLAVTWTFKFKRSKV